MDILELNRMPLTAVILFHRVGLAAILLGKHHGRDTGDLLREVIQSLSDKIARRWDVASESWRLFLDQSMDSRLTLSGHIASQLREALSQGQDTGMA